MINEILYSNKNPNDPIYAEFKRQLKSVVDSIHTMYMNQDMVVHAERIERFIERLLFTRENNIRKMAHERKKHRVWKKRAIDLGWKEEETRNETNK